MSRYTYLICLCVDLAQFGFVCPDSADSTQFRGLNALNRYFAMLAPNANAATIPDVWDGYYRITLAQFDSEASPEQLQRSSCNYFLTAMSGAQIRRSCSSGLEKLSPTTDVFRLGVESLRTSPSPCTLLVNPGLISVLLLNGNGGPDRTFHRWDTISGHLLHMNIRLYRETSEADWTRSRN